MGIGKRVSVFFVTSMLLRAQQPPITLSAAVDQALAKYPSIEVSLEQVKVAAAGINLARTSYLPRLDALAQVNRATHNNVFGLVLPQPLPVIPTMSGPVLRTNTLDSVWGTAVGVLVNWEPFDFGVRRASVAAAEASRDRAAAEVNVTRLQVAAGTAEAFLTLEAALELEKAANAAVERAKQLDTIIAALVKSELRPGAEASRSRAELAAARTQSIQARQTIAVAKAALAQMTGNTVENISAEVFLQAPANPDIPAASIDTHPMLTAQKAAIFESKSRAEILNHSYVPRFNVEGSIAARGTGIQPDGRTGSFLAGLGPNYQNWAVGLNVTFPIFDYAQLRARKDAEAHRNLAEQARYRQFTTELEAQKLKAKATLEAAREIAENTTVQVEAARAAEAQARARYQAGLNNITDVADAQRLLTQSEIDIALSRLNIWRAMLQIAVAEGDLTPFLKLAESK